MASLGSAILASQAAVVIPADDRAARHCHELHLRGTAAQRAIIEFSVGNPAFYSVTRSRVGFVGVARNCGVRVPQDALLKSEEDVAEWIAIHPAPWVIKVDGSCNGSGVHIAHAPEQAFRAWCDLSRGPSLQLALKRYLVNRDASVLGDRILRSAVPDVSAQSFVHGTPGNLAMFCKRGDVLAISVVEAEAFRSGHGPATIVRLVDLPQVVKAAKTIASALGITGFYGIDFMIDQETGQATVIEMNPRATPLCNIRIGTSRDLIGAALQSWFGLTAPTVEEPATLRLAMYPSEVDESNLQLQFAHADLRDDKPELFAAMLAPPWPERHPLARLLSGLKSGKFILR